jgi:hypothetical protein
MGFDYSTLRSKSVWMGWVEGFDYSSQGGTNGGRGSGSRVDWGGWRDLNPRSSGPQPDALVPWATPTARNPIIIAEKQISFNHCTACPELVEGSLRGVPIFIGINSTTRQSLSTD